MASLRQLREQVRSIQNIAKITRAMEMVSASKLKRAQNRLLAVRQVTQYLSTLMERVAPSLAATNHPLTRAVPDAPRHLLIILGSDTGLCGSYNERLARAALEVLKREPRELTCVGVLGKRADRMLRRTPYTVVERWLGWAGRPDPARAATLREFALARYRAGEVDRVSFVYMRFKSSMVYVPTVEQLLPIAVPTANESAYPVEYIYEPTKERALETLLEEWLRLKVWVTLLEAFTSEHSARMIAMRNATDNASELMDELTLTRNKVRQATITRELAEIVGTAEALK